MTPLQRLNNQQRIAEILSEQPPMSYFHSGNGAKFLLAITQGIQATQAFCLATEGVMATPS